MIDAHPIVSVVLVVAALLAAWQVIWKRGLVPTAHFAKSVNRIAEATPTLVQIAEDFQQNGGSSLRDAIDRIESTVGTIEEKVDDAKTAVDQVRNTWNNDRDLVLSRIAVIEARQRAIATGVVGALRGTGDMQSLITSVILAIETPIKEPDMNQRGEG